MIFLSDPNTWFSLITLVILEIILGVDNLIFIAIVVARLPKDQQKKGRIFGLGFALFTRIALLGVLFWATKLIQPLFIISNMNISVRDLVLIIGGLFLIYKGTQEIHDSIAKRDHSEHTLDVNANKKHLGFFMAVVQIGILDIVFSIDSVITAVGMANQIEVMIAAIVIAVLIMMLASGWVSNFIDTYPTLKILAFAFLFIVGIVLVADGLHFEIPKGYIYFAMLFSLGVEILNIIAHKQSTKNE